MKINIAITILKQTDKQTDNGQRCFRNIGAWDGGGSGESNEDGTIIIVTLIIEMIIAAMIIEMIKSARFR